MDINFASMSIDELEKLSSAIYREVSARKRNEQIKKWTALTDMMRDYIKQYGEITISLCDGDNVVIHSHMDFESIGEIEDLDR